jgi:hypothetical protein
VAYREDAKHFVACQVAVADISPITDGGTAKVKVRACKVLHEVDINGKQVAP